MIDMKRAKMLGGDPADRPDASYWPTYDDKPEDIFADDFAEMARAAEIKVCPEVVVVAKQAFKRATDEADTKARAAQIASQTIVTFMQRAAKADVPQLRFVVDCWLSHYNLHPLSQTEIAKRHGVTRAAVSKRCVDLGAMLGPEDAHIRTARGEKSEEARKTYTLRQLLIGATRQKKTALTETQQRKNEKWNQIKHL